MGGPVGGERLQEEILVATVLWSRDKEGGVGVRWGYGRNCKRGHVRLGGGLRELKPATLVDKHLHFD